MVCQNFSAPPLTFRRQRCNILDRGRRTGAEVDVGVFAGGMGDREGGTRDFKDSG